MIIYTIKRFWSSWGWHFIFFGGLITLFVLWIYNQQPVGSTTINMNSIIGKIFQPVTPSISTLASGYSATPQSPERNCSRGEKKCREFLEFIFKKPFENVRPRFLINPITQEALELDCYNEELRLAVEYNGKQHYEFNKMMHQNSRHCFQNQKYRDHIKKELCDKHGITLITVPYSIPEDKIGDFLYEELKKRGFIHSNLIDTDSLID